ncbi:GLPGLI family protein [Flammeovirga aprica]|uniref:GLPGLI family protein n=1 Tax=Flammeovirga aprica JL-4 TaxID=694437 RepID=A0A7X9RUB5_9BACT|nr:GLPGLI family protein [Flammeovirga aprica]NME68857.1 GLPGLI family protein [Flammeovirga aprica JL-4]
MKYIITTLLIFWSTSLHSQIKNHGLAKLSCKYIHSFQPWQNDTSRVEGEFILVLNKKYSEYQSIQTYNKEVVISKGKLNDDDITSQLGQFTSLAGIIHNMPEPKTNDIIVTKDHESNEVKVELGYLFVIRNLFIEDMSDISWNITEDSKMINGYKCFKAITNYGFYSIVAWFTPELPFSDGPYTFGGLPGL